MATINPYLTFNGNCEEVFNFYKKVFGGEFVYVGRYSEMPAEYPVPDELKNKIMHITLPINGKNLLMGCDSFEPFGKTNVFGDNFTLMVHLDSENELKNIFEGLSENGKITMPISKMFWGATYAKCTDKFGIQWSVTFDPKV